MNVIKYFGGKGMLAPRIHAVIDTLQPRSRNYVEPFAGGLSVLLAAREPWPSEVVNDLDGDVSTFWRVLANLEQFEHLKRMAEATPFSEAGFEHASTSLRLFPNAPDYQRAYWFFVRCRMSMGGMGECFAPPTRNRLRSGMNESVSSWLNAVDGLPDVHARLRRVMVLNHDAIKVIREWDTPDTLFYCDPPYLLETRTAGGYRFEMTEVQHAKLLNTLATIKGKFLLSGYRSRLYDDTATRFGWNRVDIATANHAAGGDNKRVMIECLWKNW